MKVDLESSTPQVDSQTGLPKINKRKTSQNLTVKNMQTVVVSGLVQSTEYETFKKIPLLGDIPIIGWLFRNSTVGSVRNNLVIFLTPHIIYGADDLAAVYQRKIKERDEFMELVYGSRFKKDDFYALLPKSSDGEFKEDASDRREREMREQAMRDAESKDAAEEKAAEDGENANEAAEGGEGQSSSDSIPVPFIGGGGSGDSSGGGTPLPPPPPPPPSGDGGSFEAPPPVEPPPPVE
jgi:general secretion pathway protein D